MPNKQYLKYLKSLQTKKYRQLHGRFTVEGRKNILELLDSNYRIEKLLVTPDFNNEIEMRLNHLEVELVKEKDLTTLGSFKTNNAGLAVVEMPKEGPPTFEDRLTIVLDDIRDPGNLGTIIRTADWYGLSSIVCSLTTADVYNPKVISASMGSFFRVSCTYLDLNTFLQDQSRPVMGATLDGKNVHHYEFPESGILLIGNEASGISPSLIPLIDVKLHIPGAGQAESLNAAVATAIFCDNFIRNSKNTVD